jgi:hypothetical protein
MAQAGRHTRGHPRNEGVVTSGWCSGGNCGGIASECAAGEDLGEDDPNRWVPSVSDGGMVTGWQRVEMGRGQCRVGPAAEKMAHDGFSILEFLFHFTFQACEKIK